MLRELYYAELRSSFPELGGKQPSIQPELNQVDHDDLQGDPEGEELTNGVNSAVTESPESHDSLT